MLVFVFLAREARNSLKQICRSLIEFRNEEVGLLGYQTDV